MFSISEHLTCLSIASYVYLFIYFLYFWADYSKDLLSYLKYCKDVVFAGLTTSYEEDNFIEQLWNLYETKEVSLIISSYVCLFKMVACLRLS